MTVMNQCHKTGKNVYFLMSTDLCRGKRVAWRPSGDVFVQKQLGAITPYLLLPDEPSSERRRLLHPLGDLYDTR